MRLIASLQDPIMNPVSGFDEFYKLIEQGADLDKYDSNEKITELAEGVFRQLIVIWEWFY